MKLSDIKNAYLVGIKGTGMSAVAQILASHGARVTGSDTEEKFFTEESLRKANISYVEGFSSDHITGREDVVIYSTAYHPETHPELLIAKEKNVPVMSYPESLAMLAREKLSIAVCGSHGKTTTTAMLAHTLAVARLDPSAIVGSTVKSWGSGALSGQGIHFIFEADEYQNKLALYAPWSAILTNIDYDHPDFFSTPESYRETFREFLTRIPSHGFLVVCGDDAEAVRTAKESGRRFVTYGFQSDAMYSIRLSDKRPSYAGTSAGRHATSNKGVEMQEFSVEYNGKLLGNFETQLTGRHNVQNAGGVVAMCHLLKCDMARVAEGLCTFEGTARRFEYMGERDGVMFFDDYAHHPAEIMATLKGARVRYPHKRILVVFQPHTFSRTSALFEEFAQCFGPADKVYLLDIYASAREEVGEVTSKQLTERINRYNPGRAEYVGGIEDAVEILQKEMQKNDLVMTIGAGDGWRVSQKFIKSVKFVKS